MSKLSHTARTLNTPTAAHWDAWTDEVSYGIGPDPDDAIWLAQTSGDFDSQDVPDHVLDRQADEALALDRLSRGYA